MKKVIMVLTLVIITVTLAGCGVSQTDYDKALVDKQVAESLVVTQNATIQDLQTQLSEVKQPVYFENRNAIESWLKTVPKLGISADSEEWFQYAFYYQQKAIEAGYILSVSYTANDGVVITCDIVTQDGWIYYFDPDDCELHDTSIRVDMIPMSDLDSKAIRSYQ
jgi:hypothetical protein